MVGQTIKDLLTQRQMTIAELARACATPMTTLHSIIQRDNNTIDLALLARISGTLGVPPEYFFRNLGAELPELPGDGEWALLRGCRSLDTHGREMVDLVLNAELRRQDREKKVEGK